MLRRDFRLLLVGQTTSQLGTQVSGVAVPLLAVLTLHASPFQLGVLGAAGTLAFAVVGLPAGAWLDRVLRRRRDGGAVRHHRRRVRDARVVGTSRRSRDAEMAARLWDRSERLTGVSSPGPG